MGLFPILTRRQWATVSVIGFSHFSGGVCVSIQAPFYPAEAERKGATASQYGFVFGCYHLIIFIFSPLIGKYLRVLRPNFMLTSGLFITGSCSILFGLLDQINGAGMFIGFSFAVRILEALGTTSFLTSSFAIIGNAFPESVATAIASMESFFGIGLIVGPAVGGVLFQVGGYILPFSVVGGFLFLVSLLSWIVLPAISDSPNDEESGGGLLKALRIPSVLLASFSVFTASFTLGFIDATLEPHLRSFHLTPAILGLFFITGGLTCLFTSPIWGHLYDRLIPPKIGILIGAVLISSAFLLIGPIPFLPLNTTLTLVIVGLVLAGIGIQALIVGGFSEALRAMRFYGFQENMTTYGLVSGLWSSTFALGAFAGPSSAGILLDHVGFRCGSYLVLGISCLLAVCALSFLLCNKRESAPDDHLNGITNIGTNYGALSESDGIRVC